ncbi:MAG: hypothetical protein AAF848_17050 [Pseudomonadota bacterium]
MAGLRRKRAVLVGNALNMAVDVRGRPLDLTDLAEFIDDCDLVLRMNNLKNSLAPGVGTKNDIMCVNNCGRPAMNNARRPIEFGAIEQPKRLIFPISNAERTCLVARPPEEGEDIFRRTNFASKIVSFQGWQDLPTSYINPIRSHCLRRRLADATGLDILPSTGIRIVDHVVSHPGFADFDLYIAGFTFEGWIGHEYLAEQKFILTWCAEGRLHIPPTPAQGYAAAGS